MREDSGDSLESMIEYYKVFIDLLKNTTTLAAGVLVLLATFHDKLSSGAHFRWLIIGATVCFLFCILHNVTLYYNSLIIIGEYGHDKTVVKLEEDSKKILERLRETGEKVGKLERRMRFSFRVSHWAFVGGIICVGAFVIANF
jgi:hypothetical protein